MWHLRRGYRCHAWDIFYDHYNLWKQGEIALRATEALWPNGEQPAIGQRIQCGSCGATDFKLGDMETEVITL